MAMQTVLLANVDDGSHFFDRDFIWLSFDERELVNAHTTSPSMRERLDDITAIFK